MDNQDFIEITTIGDVRTRWVRVLTGNEFRNGDTVYIIRKDGWIQVTERFAYEYPSIKESPKWRDRKYLMETLTTVNPHKPREDSGPEEFVRPRKWWEKLLGIKPHPNLLKNEDS